MRSPATPARPPSRSSPANANPRCFRWNCNKRLRSAFCALADSTRHWQPGRRTSTPPPAPAGMTTPARYAPSAARGAESCGGAGKTVCPTTPPAAAPCSNTSQSPSQHRPALCPTSLPPSGWPAPLSPEGRPAGPSAKRLTASRHPLSTPGVDTGRLLSPNCERTGRRRRGLLSAGRQRSIRLCFCPASQPVARLRYRVKGGIYLSQVGVRQGRSVVGDGGVRIGSVGRGLPGRGLTIRLR